MTHGYSEVESTLLGAVAFISWGAYLKWHFLDCCGLACARLLRTLRVEDAEAHWRRTVHVSILLHIFSPMALHLCMSMSRPFVFEGFDELHGVFRERIESGPSEGAASCTPWPAHQRAQDLQEHCRLGVQVWVIALVAGFVWNAVVGLWLEIAKERLALAQARVRLSYLWATCKGLQEIDALALEPTGSHPIRLPPVPLMGNGAAIGGNSEAVESFAGPLALLPIIVGERRLSAVHCVVGHTDGDAARLFVEDLSENGIWKNGTLVEGREEIKVGDTLTIHRCAAPFVELAYTVVDAKALVIKHIEEVRPEYNELVLMAVARESIGIRSRMMMRTLQTAYLKLSFLLVLTILPLGLLQLSWHLEISMEDYFRAFSKLPWHWDFGFVAYMLTGVMFGPIESLLCCDFTWNAPPAREAVGGAARTCAVLVGMDRRAAEQLTLPESQTFLLLVHLAVLAVLGILLRLGMLVWNRKDSMAHLAEAEDQWEDKSAEAEMWGVKAASKLLAVWRPEQFQAPLLHLPPLPEELSSLRPQGAEPAKAVPAVEAEDLKCPICLEMCENCVALLPCGHNFCDRCCKGYFARLEEPRCPYTCTVDQVMPNPVVRALLVAWKCSTSHVQEEVRAALPPTGGCSAGDLCKKPWYEKDFQRML